MEPNSNDLEKRLISRALAYTPVDKWNICYILLFIQGLGILFPWNTVITAKDYWDRRMCSPEFNSIYMYVFTFTFNVCNVLGMYFCVKYQHLYSLSNRIIVPLVLIAAIFAWITIASLISPEKLGDSAIFWSSACCMVVLGGCTAVFQAGIFGLAGLLPPIYSQAVMVGQGLAGVTVSLNGVLTTLDGPKRSANVCDDNYEVVKWNSFTFFLLSALILLFCVLAFVVLNNLPFVVYHVSKNKTEKTLGAHNTDSDRQSNPIFDDPPDPLSHLSDDNVQGLDRIDTEMIRPKSINMYEVFVQIKILFLSVMCVFAVTLSVFPTVTGKIGSTTTGVEGENRFFHEIWVPFSFLNFNLGDFFGRIVAGWYKAASDGAKWMPYVCAMRLVFIPLFLFCHTNNSLVPDYLESDAWPLAIMFCFAFTNGWFGSVCMMTGPLRVKDPNQQSTAGTMMAFGINIGLTLGSALSFCFIPLFPIK